MARLGEYTAFIDLLGSKESANVHPSNFFEGIRRFTDIVTGTAELLNDDSKLYLFSDCAFLSFSDIENFADYISNVRYHLFSSNYFFKCSVVPGELRAETWKPNAAQRALRDRLTGIVTGTTFSDVSVAAFLLQEQYKGVGVVVDKGVSGGHKIIDSIYFSNDDVRSIRQCRDIRFSRSEVGVIYRHGGALLDDTPENHSVQENAESYIRSFLASVISAKTKERKYGRYYASSLISFVKSSDFSRLVFDEESGWQNYPIMFRYLFMNRMIEKMLIDVLGWEYIYVAALGEIFKQRRRMDHQTESAIVIELLRRPRVARRLTSSPDTIIQATVREDLLRKLSVQATKRFA
jgi:hypothetical protein